ncbi:unnamed protein product [Phytophthora fragariaefolia]|uniref:Unnamed protein product n=1 Tax=Phytophthora fragariaefolia TaxID=1490495 RepID=A0A9W7D4F9_9STRA|nr:unnamed protein product [Phytophthora fragariaefolia]
MSKQSHLRSEQYNATHQIDNKLGDFRHELQVEEVGELVGPGPVHPGVHHVQHVSQERGHDRHEQDQELAKSTRTGSAASHHRKSLALQPHLKSKQDEDRGSILDDLERAPHHKGRVHCCQHRHEPHESHVGQT